VVGYYLLLATLMIGTFHFLISLAGVQYPKTVHTSIVPVASIHGNVVACVHRSCRWAGSAAGWKVGGRVKCIFFITFSLKICIFL
jgi:hypothetical protein